MLKLLHKSEEMEEFLLYSELKCAEVFIMRNNEFSIQCTYCKLKSFEFTDFIAHFRNVHSAPDLLHCKDVVCEEKNLLLNHDEESVEILTVSKARFTDIDVQIPSPVTQNDGWDWQSQTSAEEECTSNKSEVIISIFERLNSKTAQPTHNTKPARSDKAEFKCTECKISYKFNTNLARHMQKCHDSTGYKCSTCAANFRSVKELKQHEAVTHNASFSCNQCNKMCKTKKYLKYHELSHADQRNFHCPVEHCGKSFPSKRHLRDHSRNVHEMKRNFVCEMCGFATKRQPDLIVHRRIHTGEKPFECDICGKCFISKKLLSEHAPVHSMERPHVCEVCSATFSRPKALYHHKHLHLGEKKFVCKLCGRAYAQMAGLAGHMRQHRANQGILDS